MVVEMALRWLPFDGPDSYETIVTFGLTPAQFGERLLGALDARATAEEVAIPSATMQKLRDLANRYRTRE